MFLYHCTSSSSSSSLLKVNTVHFKKEKLQAIFFCCPCRFFDENTLLFVWCFDWIYLLSEQKEKFLFHYRLFFSYTSIAKIGGVERDTCILSIFGGIVDLCIDWRIHLICVFVSSFDCLEYINSNICLNLHYYFSIIILWKCAKKWALTSTKWFRSATENDSKVFLEKFWNEK